MSGVVLRATRSPDEGLPRLASGLVMLLGLFAFMTWRLWPFLGGLLR